MDSILDWGIKIPHGTAKEKKIPNATPDDKKSEKNVTATDGIGKL